MIQDRELEFYTSILYFIIASTFCVFLANIYRRRTTSSYLNKDSVARRAGKSGSESANIKFIYTARAYESSLRSTWVQSSYLLSYLNSQFPSIQQFYTLSESSFHLVCFSTTFGGVEKVYKKKKFKEAKKNKEIKNSCNNGGVTWLRSIEFIMCGVINVLCIFRELQFQHRPIQYCVCITFTSACPH